MMELCFFCELAVIGPLQRQTGACVARGTLEDYVAASKSAYASPCKEYTLIWIPESEL